MTREDYVHPPLVATEPVSERLSAWRFRIVLVLVLVAIVTGLVLSYLALTGAGEGSPGVTPGG